MIYSSEHPRMGLVIGTYGSVPYIHLQLESWRRNCSQLPALIHDDCSPDGPRLEKLCRDYGADFYTNPSRKGHVPGDMLAYINGLSWAIEHEVELLVKFSRRFIPLKPWQEDLGKLAFESQCPTFSGRCLHNGFGFRSECVGFHVQSWRETDAMRPLREALERAAKMNPKIFADNQAWFLVEAIVHQASALACKIRCQENIDYEKLHPANPGCGNYVDWSLLGDNRNKPQAGLLWHNNSRAHEYHRALMQWGINCYKPGDFIDKSANLQK